MPWILTASLAVLMAPLQSNRGQHGGKLPQSSLVSSVLRSHGVISGTAATQQYRGGHGGALVRLLRGLGSGGLCLRNFSPESVVIVAKDDSQGADSLLLVDSCPHDWAPYSREEYEAMCANAFLSFRFGSYVDRLNDGSYDKLKSWLSRTGTEASRRALPELSGFQDFYDLVQKKTEGAQGEKYDSLPFSESSREMLPQGLSAIIDQCPDISVGVSDGTREGLPREFAVHVQDPLEALSTEGRRSRIPLWRLRRLLRRKFEVIRESTKCNECDVERFEPWMERHSFFLRERDIAAKKHEATLLIKSCPQEHGTLVANVRHIVHQLEKMTSFAQIILLCDWSRDKEFLRGYGPKEPVEGRLQSYEAALKQVEESGLVDRILHFGRDLQVCYACTSAEHPEGSVCENPACFRKLLIDLNKRWLGLKDCEETHSTSGPQYASTFFGFEHVETDVVLQIDSDIILNVMDMTASLESSEFPHRWFDLVWNACELFDRRPRAVTCLALPIASEGAFGACGSEFWQPESLGTAKPHRFEIRCAFLHLQRLKKCILPLQVHDTVNRPVCGWYRLLDHTLAAKGWESYRGNYDVRNFFVHPENTLKANRERYLLTVDRMSSCQASLLPGHCALLQKVRENQCGAVNLAESVEWFGERSEPIVFVVMGWNVKYGRALRCLRSLAAQRGVGRVGVILSDDASDCEDTRLAMFCEARRLFNPERLTLINTQSRIGVNRNFRHCVSRVCSNPDSIIVTLDLDDMLLMQPENSPSIVEYVEDIYNQGEVNVLCMIGGMVRPHKSVSYAVDLDCPRFSPAAGNTWLHLRTFRKYLLDRIREDDFLDENGETFDVGSDWSIMIPIAEQAGSARIHIVPSDKSFYFYEECKQAYTREWKHQELARVKRRLEGLHKYDRV